MGKAFSWILDGLLNPMLYTPLSRSGFLLIIKSKLTRITCLRRGKKHVNLSNSQPQLLKSLHREERRGGVPLQDLHLVSVPHQRAADQFIQQGLFSQVYFIPVFPATSIVSPLRHNVACTGGNNTKNTSNTTTKR